MVIEKTDGYKWAENTPSHALGWKFGFNDAKYGSYIGYPSPADWRTLNESFDVLTQQIIDSFAQVRGLERHQPDHQAPERFHFKYGPIEEVLDFLKE